MFKYSLRILRIRRKNGECVERKFLLSTMPDEDKGTVFQEHLTEDHKLAHNEQITNFIFGNL
jgi:hypothetical protein